MEVNCNQTLITNDESHSQIIVDYFVFRRTGELLMKNLCLTHNMRMHMNLLISSIVNGFGVDLLNEHPHAQG